VAIVSRESWLVISSSPILFLGNGMAPLLLLWMIGVHTERADEDGVALFFPEYMDLRLSG
jgi:hypothetical protein